MSRFLYGGFMSTTYPITFRLSATVQLTEREILNLLAGDSEPIRRKLETGEIELGGGDSYLPGSWITDNEKLPKSVHDAHDGDDVDIVV